MHMPQQIDVHGVHERILPSQSVKMTRHINNYQIINNLPIDRMRAQYRPSAAIFTRLRARGF